MKIEHSGWTKASGSYRYVIEIDEKKTDYEIYFKNGTVGKQTTPFRVEERDWNNDGDVYCMFGAFFDYFNKEGKQVGCDFWTPDEMASVLIDSFYNDPFYSGPVVVGISGVKLPEKLTRSSLSEQVQRSEQACMARDIEKNRKMNALGIREPGEPWAR